MRPFQLILFSIIFYCPCFAQEKTRFAERFYCNSMAATFHFIQAKGTWSPSNPWLGIQYKRIKSDNEAGIFTFFTGQSVSLNYSKLNGQDYLSANAEAHFRSFPITAGIIRIGAGIDCTSNFDQNYFVSGYPSVGLDIGGVEITYAYLINGYSSSQISDHRISLAIGLWVKSKNL